MSKKHKKYLIVTGSLALSLFTASSVFAASPRDFMRKNFQPGVVGIVSAVSGSNITLAGNNGTTYSVDASNAKIIKAEEKATAAIGDIHTGDTLIVRGTVSGNAVSATTIVDGFRVKRVMKEAAHFHKGNIALGTVSLMSGSGFSLIGHKGHASSTWNVVTSDTTVFKKSGKPASSTDLIIGDRVMVTGTRNVSTSTFTATHVNILPMVGKKVGI